MTPKNRIAQALLAAVVLFFSRAELIASPEPDTPFKQAVSVKYLPEQDLKGADLKKIVVDYNDVVYVLSDRGVLRICDGKLIKDTRYTPLTASVPRDICAQEKTGHLYYLYDDHVLTNGYAGKPFFKLPKNKYNMMAVDSAGNVLLANENSVAVCNASGLKEIEASLSRVQSISIHGGKYYVVDKNSIYTVVNFSLKPLHKHSGLTSVGFLNNEIVVGTAGGYYSINATTGDTIRRLTTRVPVPEITSLQTVNGNIWAGTSRGGFMQDKKGKFRYYASKRWLDDDRVTGVANDSKGNVYFFTATGVNEIRFTEMSLSHKTNWFQDKIRKSHIRYGFISNVEFEVPGDRSTSKLSDTDNDGLWSGFYLGSQAFRYAVTGDADAKRYAWETFEAFERLLSINPLKGFPARTFERKGFKTSDPERWHDSQEEGWEWKGTTSSDEFVGYIWVSALMHEMVAKTKAEKKRVADFIDAILTHIIENDYYFIDADGKPTLWGRWNPEYINAFPKTVGDRRLGSTTIIAGLQLGYSLTNKKIYRDEAYRLMNKHGYLENIQIPYNNIQPTKGAIHQGVDLGDGGWNHSDDEMAFLTYWVLHHYAFDAGLKRKYESAIEDHWKIERPEKNPVWNLISLGTTGNFDKASTLWVMREFPMDLIRWDIKNSHRKDIEILPPNFRKQYTKELLPSGERPVHRHNANAFDLDGGEHGMSELAGDEYLLPYWMARYLKVIQ